MAKDLTRPSRNTKKEQDLTQESRPNPAEGGQMGDGEGFPPGSKYSATLVERQNKSINRNNDVQDRPSANGAMLPNVDMGVRKTGRI